MEDSGFKSSRVLIAGLGLIGGSAAKALRAAGFSQVDGLDSDWKTLAQAKRDGAIRAGYAELQAGDYDLVLCCVPPESVAALYEQTKPHLKPGGVFAELTGLKEPVIASLLPLLDARHELLCLHPMAGREKSGYENSDAAVFLGSVMILTPTIRTEHSALAWAVVLKDAFGCDDMPSLRADRHDEIVARVSHLPHLAALAVREAAAGCERYAGGSYKSVTRVAEINAALWAGLLTENAEYVVESIGRCQQALETLRDAVEARNAPALRKLLEKMSKGGKP